MSEADHVPGRHVDGPLALEGKHLDESRAGNLRYVEMVVLVRGGFCARRHIDGVRTQAHPLAIVCGIFRHDYTGAIPLEKADRSVGPLHASEDMVVVFDADAYLSFPTPGPRSSARKSTNARIRLDI